MTLLIDFNAERGDDPKKLGTLNLEKGKGDKPNANTDDLYIKLGTDWKGMKCAHYHHKAGYRRAEYHALKSETKAGTTYFITYKLALQQRPDGLILFQWKEYKANNDHDMGANIPLSLEVRKNQLAFSHTFKWKEGRKVQWTHDVEAHQEHKIGLEILAKAKDGHVKLWFDGKPVTFDTTKSPILTGNMFPGQSDPKFGIYGGEDVQVDSYVYQVQIGTSKGDVNQSFFG
ncbi:hypothetical protein F4821DRAFT_244200 [Hypoxylon rubiginosum]|uniref:Uncharacterized protein n=1 Tax=Hypoxylon rubiginosum TaxID=110542 RepID=A0ACC0CTK1_9PEZI|nr:hypothetical protein F4821DRAFT_244200 [Hypoxylon rubiginosum]